MKRAIPMASIMVVLACTAAHAQLSCESQLQLCQSQREAAIAVADACIELLGEAQSAIVEAEALRADSLAPPRTRMP